MKALIVGAGIMGLSTAWALAKRGHDVTVVEQGPIPNPFGSSVDQHRLIRYAYGDMAGYSAMIGQAYAAWERLWQDLGERLYVETGTLAVGTEGQQWLNDSIRVLRAQDHEVDVLQPDVLEKRFPLLRGDGIDQAYHLTTGGVLLAGRIVELLGHHLAQRRVTLLARHTVKAVDPERSSIQLTNGQILEGDKLVVAAGPWVTQLLPNMATRVTPSRQLVAYMTPPAELRGAWSRMPMLLDIEPDRGFYAVPSVAGTGLKISDHSFSMTGDPDMDREAAEQETRDLFLACKNRLASFDRYSLDVGKTCFYTVNPLEERFILEPIGTTAWIMTGFTGHGFKFGALMGEAMADGLEERRPAGELSRWAAGYLD